MRQSIHHTIETGILLLVACMTWGQTFKASHLQRAYEKLHLATNTQLRNHLSIRTDDRGIIEHIGIPMFSTEMRTLLPSPVYDYLEYALLDHKYHINENALQQLKLRFQNGDWSDLEQVRPSNKCTINNVDDKWYVVTWSRYGKSNISVAIPIDYELLANSSRKEMEQIFISNLQKHHPATISGNIPLMPELSDINTTLSLEFQLYGHHKKTIDVSLAQWLSYGLSTGSTPLYIYEGRNQNTDKAVLLMENRQEGYAHMISVNIPINNNNNGKATCNGKAYLYIPISNITRLYEKAPHHQSTPKKYEN